MDEKMNRFCLTVFFALLFFLEADAQEHERLPVNARANYHYGALLPEYGVLNYLSQDFVNGYELSFSWQTTGKSIWERLYRYPQFGLGFFTSNLSNDVLFGRQYSLYPNYTLHITERENFDFNYQLGVGATYTTRKFDFSSNAQNVAVGSHFNIHFHSHFEVKYRVHGSLFANAGLAFNHFSNANLSEPNLGLNYATAFAGISYTTGKPADRNHEPVAPMDPHFEFAASVFGGMKHTRTFESFQYPAVSMSFDAARRIGHKFAWGIGADFFYDSSIEVQMERLNKPYRSTDSFTSGMHASAEFIYSHFSLILQQGVYIGLTDKLNGHSLYNRALLRYRLGKHWYASMSMKSYFVVLDFPEAGFGYHW